MSTNEARSNDQDSTMNTTSHSASSAVPQKKDGFVKEIVKLSLIALLVVLPIRLFIAQPFVVSGASMETTFSTGQYLIVDQLSYHFVDPARGDVIVFRYPKDPSKYFIKRIIGLPGDTVTIEGNDVSIRNKDHLQGVILNEDSYAPRMSENNMLSETLGTNEYFVMGDNRDASSDSRMWGTLPRANIVGRAFLRLFPFSEIDLLPGKYDINSEVTNSPS